MLYLWKASCYQAEWRNLYPVQALQEADTVIQVARAESLEPRAIHGVC